MLKEQEKLLSLKKQLTKIERETLLARLDESQMISARKLSSFQNFESRMQIVKDLSKQLISTYQKQAPEVAKTMAVGLQILEKYQTSVGKTFAIQETMGMGEETGILPELKEVKRNLETQLEQVNNSALEFEFAHMQLYEKDFSSTLDMRLSTKLLDQVSELSTAIEKENLPPQLQQSLLLELERYRTLVSLLLDKTLELELVTAENRLQFERIAPNIAENQAKVDRSLSSIARELQNQRRISTLQAIFVFSSAFAILLMLMFFQIRSAQLLIARLQQLAKGMREIAAGQFESQMSQELVAEMQLPHGEDEIGILTENFLAMSAKIRTQISTIEQERTNAEAANQAKSQFLASMSHELRTPLNAILGFAQLMVRDSSFSPEQQEHLRIIQRSGEHLLELINDILDMSKIEAGRVSLNVHDFDLHRLLDTLEEMLGLKANSQGLQLYIERDRALPQYIMADEGKLRQVLINLLGNAIKFTAEGRVTLRVQREDRMNKVQNPPSQKQATELREQETGKRDKFNVQSSMKSPPISQFPQFPIPDVLSFEIEDTGPGIAPEEIDLLFAAFTQTEAGRNSGQGTGLGLPISQRFVALMGGEIRVRSVAGQGTVFSFQIPVEVSQECGVGAKNTDRDANPKREAKPIALQPGQPTYRILIAEDNPDNRMLLNKLLTGVGFEVREATNGREAIALWESWHPHLIWMDIQMPEMDGCDATRQIRAREAAESPVTIIALTTSAFSDERDEILAAGCDDFMSKPFQESALFARIEKYLGARYLYAVPSSEPQETDEIAFADLAVMPPEWIASLHRAALEADTDKITDLIEQIPTTQSAIAQVLGEWVYNFQCEQIIALVESDSA